MSEQDIDALILHYLYNKSFISGDATLYSLQLWEGRTVVNNVSFWDHYNQLVSSGVIIHLEEEDIVRLSPKGVLFCEKSGLASPELVLKNREMRKRFLHALAEQASSCSTLMSVDELVEVTGDEENYYLGNIDLLIDLGYIKWIIPRVNFSINMNVCAREAAVSHFH